VHRQNLCAKFELLILFNLVNSIFYLYHDDFSRKEKEVHCLCDKTARERKGLSYPALYVIPTL